jgi:hypothetical protein
MTEAAKKNDSASGDDRAGLREGEIAIELPERFDAHLVLQSPRHYAEHRSHRIR